ncbi:ABC transporter ATP-binding protein [Gynurincola endophyticus]|jgi:ABC-type multidrug transport system ATPase subunit|uniref:ABC transporter ATP-binding protein n=1 Tax=Gynurincola endophyticus TaxID=2479004 RepID=UPI000F8D7281|nr:ATP-binding cassette domain-containing protein [Gynurincola endophyticus]
MKISLNQIGKRFNREWIFRNFVGAFSHEYTYAIVGPNGSGKSTLLQIIAGAVAHSEGKLEYELQGRTIAPENIFQQISWASPAMELIEEFTATEMLTFHQKFKPLLKDVSIEEMLSIVNLSAAANKQIRFYSSGMKQRVKLLQALMSDVPCVLLDEPCMNLDKTGIELYQNLVTKFRKDRLIIVSSNDPQEYFFCDKEINITDYK